MKGLDERGMESSGEERCQEKGEAAGEGEVGWLRMNKRERL